ncbi:MAG: NAD(P)-dependent oxidoreductase [Chloroflexota bacterium]
MSKPTIALFGASGTMGFQAFRELWRRRDRINLSILALPEDQKRGIFDPYLRQAGAPRLRGRGIARGDGLKIVWGDATCYEDVVETIRGADRVLNAMAYISPMADYNPEQARRVNVEAVTHILRAIHNEPHGAERIAYVHTGSVAQTGNRPPGIHIGRVGDPLKPAVFDYYALTKIEGERLVLESGLRYWVSLRMSFILPTRFNELLSLFDPILFHMPLDTCMENITDRDAGYGLANCAEIPLHSDFWRRVYNMGGGEDMRTTAQEFLRMVYNLFGLRLEACTERRWFATRNFHLQFFEDSCILNDFLHHQRDTLADFQRAILESMPLPVRLARILLLQSPALRRAAENLLYRWQRRLVENHPNSPLYWVKSRNHWRIRAFYKSMEDFLAIPGWKATFQNTPPATFRRLNHGYDEHQPIQTPADLQRAAAFRGGEFLSDQWNGDWNQTLEWRCAFGHSFKASPYTVLKAGHWCPVCVAQWNGDQQARRNPYFAQVWYADHDPEEDNFYPLEGLNDIRGANLPTRKRRAVTEAWQEIFSL